MRTPFHEEAVADAAEQTRDEEGARVANAAAIVVVGNVQALVQTVFDAAKTSPVQFQPLLCVEFLRLSTGQQGDVFILATVGLAQQSGGLCRQGKTNLLSRDWLG